MTTALVTTQTQSTHHTPSGLTPLQEAFAVAYAANGGKGERAALEAGYSKPSARTLASRMLRNPLILQRIHEESVKLFAVYAPAALGSMAQLSRAARSELVRFQASADLLDRAGLQPTKRVDHVLEGTISVTIDLG